MWKSGTPLYEYDSGVQMDESVLHQHLTEMYGGSGVEYRVCSKADKAVMVGVCVARRVGLHIDTSYVPPQSPWCATGCTLSAVAVWMCACIVVVVVHALYVLCV